MLRSRVFGPLALVLVTALAGCTSGATFGSSGTVTLSTSGSAPDRRPTTATGTATSISPTPVTPDGLLTGPGVDDTTITLGLLVDAADDRGFSVGVALWQRAVNLSGGLCGRTIATVSNRRGESATSAYPRVAAGSIGLITLPAGSDTSGLAERVVADQIPALTLSGSSATLSPTGPVPIGATDDIQAINTLDYLRTTGRLPAGSTLGTVTDSSARATNALAGARWWAGAHDVSVQSRGTGAAGSPWPGVSAVLVIAAPSDVSATLAATPADVRVVTDLDGYRPAQVPSPAGRLLVSLPAPAYGSDNPGAAAVAKEFVAEGRTAPGPNLLSGYGVAAAWGRLLTEACVRRSLTRAGVRAATTAIGPASVDSLFGPSDPGLVVKSGLPATRLSSVALADPAAPAGLRPLIWLSAARGIADYVPAR